MKVAIDSQQFDLPEFLIVGAAKCATTTIHYYLSEHPQVCMSRIKEPNFFCFYSKRPAYKLLSRGKVEEQVYENYMFSLTDYCRLYECGSEEQTLGEASTNYLYLHEETIKNIKVLYGDAARRVKIIIVLRNPIDRAWSHYSFVKRNGRENLDFPDATSEETIKGRMDSGIAFNWDYIGFGMYADQVRAYKEAFDDVLVLLMEDIKDSPAESMRQVAEFLEIDPDVPFNSQKVYNVSGRPKNILLGLVSRLLYEPTAVGRLFKRVAPLRVVQQVKRFRYALSCHLFVKDRMSEEDRRRLKDIYRADISKLGVLLGRKLDHWAR